MKIGMIKLKKKSTTKSWARASENLPLAKFGQVKPSLEKLGLDMSRLHPIPTFARIDSKIY